MRSIDPIFQNHTSNPCYCKYSSLDHSGVKVSCRNGKLEINSLPKKNVNLLLNPLKRPVITKGTSFYNERAYHCDIRLQLLDWLSKPCTKLYYGEKTKHLALYLIDGILSLFNVPEESFKIVAFMALHLAAKLEEPEHKIPTLKAISMIFEGETDLETIRETKLHILSIFDYNITFRTVYVELEEQLWDGVVFCTDFNNLPKHMHEETCLSGLNDTLDEIRTAYLSIYELYKFHPLVTACSIICISRKHQGLLPWPMLLQNRTRSSVSIY